MNSAHAVVTAPANTPLPVHDEQLWQRFLDYDLSLVTQTFKEREPEYAGIADDLEFECKRFLYATALVESRHLVPSEAIDEYWHHFILFTQEYHDFCTKTVGKFIHHYPIGGEDTEQVFDETRMLLETLFGEFANLDLWASQDAARSKGRSCCGSGVAQAA